MLRWSLYGESVQSGICKPVGEGTPHRLLAAKKLTLRTG